MMKKRITEKVAKSVSKWLMKDIKLNAKAASSPHMFEPKVPDELKKYKKNV